jgi:hypothetical protein
MGIRFFIISFFVNWLGRMGVEGVEREAEGAEKRLLAWRTSPTALALDVHIASVRPTACGIAYVIVSSLGGGAGACVKVGSGGANIKIPYDVINTHDQPHTRRTCKHEP